MPEQPHRYKGLSVAVAALKQKRAAEEAAWKEALRVVERWNAERPLLWSPTIRCAIVAGTPWLDVYCPGRTSRAIDICTLDRHRLASVGSLVIGLRCSLCPGSAPMPMLTGLHAFPKSRRPDSPQSKRPAFRAQWLVQPVPTKISYRWHCGPPRQAGDIHRPVAGILQSCPTPRKASASIRPNGLIFSSCKLGVP
jgi:hypothetical protein